MFLNQGFEKVNNFLFASQRFRDLIKSNFSLEIISLCILPMNSDVNTLCRSKPNLLQEL